MAPLERRHETMADEGPAFPLSETTANNTRKNNSLASKVNIDPKKIDGDGMSCRPFFDWDSVACNVLVWSVVLYKS